MSAPSPTPPGEFRRAVDALTALRPRTELVVTPIPPPRRLAPWTWAMGVDAPESPEAVDEPDTTGRLVLLYDPAGREAWAGRFRFVCFVQARLEPGQIGDELLPAVGWSWLTDALDSSDAAHVALSGTVTQTSSVRFGEMSGVRRTDDVELRASWSPENVAHGTDDGDVGDLSAHGEAFCALIASAAGLPPVGVSTLERHAP